jgi:hypothetical protein
LGRAKTWKTHRSPVGNRIDKSTSVSARSIRSVAETVIKSKTHPSKENCREHLLSDPITTKDSSTTETVPFKCPCKDDGASQNPTITRDLLVFHLWKRARTLSPDTVMFFWLASQSSFDHAVQCAIEFRWELGESVSNLRRIFLALCREASGPV